MRVHLTFLLEKVKSSFWLLPSTITFLLVGALVVLKDLRFSSDSSFLADLLFNNISLEDSRTILGSISTSVMTVVGVLFSIMIVVLQQASAQYNPRIVQNFTRSTVAQIVLGLYIGTFTYSLLLLSILNDKQVPQLAMTFAIFLALSCLFLLIYYVYHVMKNLQSTQIIANITDEGVHTLKNLVFDNDKKKGSPPTIGEFTFSIDVCSPTRGYVQAVEWDKLKKNMENVEWYAKYYVTPGSYVQVGECLVTLYGKAPWSEKYQNLILKTISIGDIRTNAQDPSFSIQKLVDIGLKATSPSINDPSTAIEALRGIEALLLQRFQKDINCIMEIDHGWVEMPYKSIKTYIGLSYDQLIKFSSSHLPVLDVIEEQLMKFLVKTPEEEVQDALQERIKKVRRERELTSKST
jgi:uncharacterized membrane protein